MHELKSREVALKATEQPVDTGTAAGKAFLDMLGVFAEFETNLRRERQLEGISAAKEPGVLRSAQHSGRRNARHRLQVERLFLSPFTAAIRRPSKGFEVLRIAF